MKTYFVFLILVTMALAGCEQVISVDLDQGTTLLAVNGQLTDRTTPDTLYLTYTSPYFQNSASPVVNGAVVVLSDDKGNSETLKEAKPGSYVMSLRGKVGNSYALNIKLATGESYTAQTQFKRNSILTSLKLYNTQPTPFDKQGFYVYAFALEPNGEGDNYRFKKYRNDTLAARPGDLSYVEDKLVDGGTSRIDTLIQGQPYKKLDSLLISRDPYHINDKVRFEIWSITADQYRFYDELQAQINNGGLFANPPANIRTNVFNNDPKGRKAVGYFGASAVTGKELIVK